MCTLLLLFFFFPEWVIQNHTARARRQDQGPRRPLPTYVTDDRQARDMLPVIYIGNTRVREGTLYLLLSLRALCTSGEDLERTGLRSHMTER